ncbi:hypothetical protein ACQ4M4_00430 [Leptolyngbya sp. AN02str]|uniref:hypothetical protein n=1 Tax=Leptolyngbya sp. AN02str TaxID=3423363 RepID=UPI003D32192C
MIPPVQTCKTWIPFSAGAVLLVASGVFVPAQANAPVQVAQTPESYQTIAKNAWSFDLPVDFQPTEIDGLPNASNVSLEALYTGNNGLLFVNLVTEPLQPGDQDGYLDNSIQFLGSAGFNVIGEERLQVGSLNAADVESSMSSTPPVRVLQRIVASPSTGYALTCGTLESNFESIRETCASILSSLEIAAEAE